MFSLPIRKIVFSTLALAMLLGASLSTGTHHADARAFPNIFARTAAVGLNSSGNWTLFVTLKNTSAVLAVPAGSELKFLNETLNHRSAIIPRIAPGATITVEIPVNGCSQFGAIVADFNNVIAESNETDNSISFGQLC